MTAWIKRALSLTAFGLAGFSAISAFSSPDDTTDQNQELEVASAIQELREDIDDPTAYRYAKLFIEAGEENILDPLLLVAIARRESNLDEFAVGERGEIGLMQNHGVSLNFRPRGCTKALEGARCQIHTGARFLAYSRDRCGGSTWQWLGSYGARECQTEEWARNHKSTKNARRFYDQIGGTEWPR